MNINLRHIVAYMLPIILTLCYSKFVLNTFCMSQKWSYNAVLGWFKIKIKDG